MVDVTGIDRNEILHALWKNSKPAAFFDNIPDAAPAYRPIKKEEIQYGGYVDYHCGRLIKSDVFGESNTIDPHGYDRDYGQGAFERVVNSLRTE